MPLIDVLVSALADPANFKPELSVEMKALAIEQGVATLLADIARDADRGWCDEVLKRSWAAHERSLWNLRKILGALDDAGVAALCLKGPLLALRLYTPPYLRKPSIDIDLAVREHDLEPACDALTRVGYRMNRSPREAARESHHVVLEHTELSTVELHFRLSHGVAGIPVADLFPRAVSCTMPCGYRASILSPADELLHLVLHLVQDRFALLFHFAEVRRAWRAAPLEIREEAIRRGIEYRFTGAFLIADAAFRYRWKEPLLPGTVSLPRTWLDWRLNEDHYRAWETRLLAAGHHSFAERIRGRWFDLQSTDSPMQALRMVRSALRTARVSIAGVR